MIVILFVGQICSGIGSLSLVGLSLVIASDFCSDLFRQRAVISFNLGLNVALLVQGVFAYF